MIFKNPEIKSSRKNATIQTKLTIGQPDDKYEVEADAMADQVMPMPQPDRPVQRKNEEEEEALQMKPLATSITPVIQKQDEEEEEETLQMKQGDSKGNSLNSLPSQLTQSKGSGSVLPEATNNQMSKAFGTDFSDVRIHTNSNAEQMNRSLGARAFTHGSDVYFNKGEYKPDVGSGKHLLAHELTHVVQQGGVKNRINKKPKKESKKERKAREAEELAQTRTALDAQKKMWEDLNAFFPGKNVGRKLAGSGYDASANSLRVDLTSGTQGNVSHSGPTMYVGQNYTGLADSLRKSALETEMLKVDEYRVEKGRIDDQDVSDPIVDGLINKLEEADLQALVTSMQSHSKYIANTAIIAHVNAKIAVLQQIAKAKEEIVTTFKVTGVVDGDAKWNLPELVILKDALTMLPAKDKDVLIGVEIKRVSSLGGNVAGEFENKVGGYEEGDTTFEKYRIMRLANLAFSGGDVAESKRIIIHEVGHGMAGQKLFEAQVASNEAGIDRNKKAEETQTSFDDWKAAKEAADDTQKDLDAKRIEAKNEKDPATKTELEKEVKELEVELKTKRAEQSKALKVNQTALAAYKTAQTTATSKESKAKALDITPAQLASIKRSNDLAKSAHDKSLASANTAVGKITISDSDVQAYHDAVQEVSTELETFYTDTLAQDKKDDAVSLLVTSVDSKIKDRDTAKEKLTVSGKGAKVISVYSNLESAQAKLFYAAKKHALAKGRNKKVQEFATFVESKNIAPITPYAAENWPHKPEEFYAEAYSFWVSGKLKAVSLTLHNWFQSGKYK
jgi:uncharacterized protein DUF4157